MTRIRLELGYEQAACIYQYALAEYKAWKRKYDRLFWKDYMKYMDDYTMEAVYRNMMEQTNEYKQMMSYKRIMESIQGGQAV